MAPPTLVDSVARVFDVARLHRGTQTRAATFENPTAAKGAGGQAHGGRKGAPSRVLAPGERVRLADLTGPGRVTHIWATFAAGGEATTPAMARAQLLEASYGDADGPSVSVPAADFFGAVHGMRVPFASALVAVNEGLGYTSRVPMPFADTLTIDWENRSAAPITLYYQVDVLLGTLEDDTGFLHAEFRRDNPTELGRDFVVADGLTGPGRFLGWTGGVRVFDPTRWWGEGEVKMYFDGDGLPTVCGTGSEDYLDSAWGLGSFFAPETGAPAVFAGSDGPDHHHRLVAFYRWHLSDPVVFEHSLRVTIQQIGMATFRREDRAAWDDFRSTHRPAGAGWIEPESGDVAGYGLYERQDDWCATAFTYCARPQPVRPCRLDDATADLVNSRRQLRLVYR
jgi:hypothetical protein